VSAGTVGFILATQDMSQVLQTAAILRWFSGVVFIVLLTMPGIGCQAGDGINAGAWLSPEEMYERVLAFEGLGVEPIADSWRRKAAEAGHPIAQVEIGFLYRYGAAAFLRDPYESQRWFLRVAKDRVPMALADFGAPGADAFHGSLRGGQEAEHWFREGVASCHDAAARGNLEAQTLLGGLYGAGAGVEQNRVTALRLWHDAAEKGHAPAQLILGRLAWHEGRYDEAHRWLLSAAAQGQPEAAYLLSDLYQVGRGVEPDHREAVTWLLQAADQGYGLAQRQLQGMRVQGLF